MEQLKPFKTYEEQVAHLKETHSTALTGKILETKQVIFLGGVLIVLRPERR